MNLTRFRQDISTHEDSLENNLKKFKAFKIWSLNEFVAYEKKFKDEVSFSHQMVPGECEEITEKWTYIDVECVIRIYSEMGWIIEDCDRFDVQDVFKFFNQIKCINDEIDFCYAICVLIKLIPENSNFSLYYTKNIFSAIQKCELEKIVERIDIDNVETVFIAMSFNEKMKKAREEIKTAISICGYKPILIDVKEHNNQIVPEIYSEIEKSKFVIADLTGQRGGVYYEAGYAAALKKTVIMSCNKSEFKKVHFDVAQTNIIFWDSEEDLQERLIKRIKSTIKKV